MQRRTFLQASTAACLASCTKAAPPITGEIVGANHAAGHWLRDLKAPPEPAHTLKTDVVVAGGGVSGLMAALRLQQSGIENITLLDLESVPGGNARSGANSISGYPWGAHYVPVPGPGAVEVRRLFEELGIITGHDAAGRPEYKEDYLCSDPQERLFSRGVWQEGLLPTSGATAAEQAEMARFESRMEDLKRARGRDDRRVFTIPLDLSSRDPDWLALDNLTMDAWMTREGFKSEPLRWYVNYCCRDDYGAGIAQVSAWAGLHYFASRDESDVLTWPRGNGWLVQHIMAKLRGVQIRQAVVYRMIQEGGMVRVDGYLPAENQALRWEARAAVCAMPRFVARRVVGGLAPPPDLQYSPWVVANLTWNAPPPGAWDNVFRESPSLGYVVATHQNLNPFPVNSVLTWYQPLDHASPPQARQQALDKPWAAWRDQVLEDLRPAHPEVMECVSRIDVMLWGHGMIRPVPGFISGAARRQMAEPLGRIAFAHTDMSGISLFEEACTRGAAAANTVAHWLGTA